MEWLAIGVSITGVDSAAAWRSHSVYILCAFRAQPEGRRGQRDSAGYDDDGAPATQMAHISSRRELAGERRRSGGVSGGLQPIGRGDLEKAVLPARCGVSEISFVGL